MRNLLQLSIPLLNSSVFIVCTTHSKTNVRLTLLISPLVTECFVLSTQIASSLRTVFHFFSPYFSRLSSAEMVLTNIDLYPVPLCLTAVSAGNHIQKANLAEATTLLEIHPYKESDLHAFKMEREISTGQLVFSLIHL